jgi:pimeloyl-ACP methyl ester carboxylesterase
MSKLKAIVRILKSVAIFYVAACLTVGVLLAEFSLRLHKLPLEDVAVHRSHLQHRFRAQVTDVSLTAADGAVLAGWFIQPPNPTGKSVIILHGLTANRVGSISFAEVFLDRGYSVLVPDSRDHGESGGAIETYGILERNDIRLWTKWIRQRAPGCTYLLGESLGAAIGLQATAVTPSLCAVAVESPYATFRAISYDRLGGEAGTGSLFWKTLGRPILEVAIAYTKLRYGIYLPDANPKAAVERASTPTLLIAGTADRDIPMHHAQELEAACPSHCALWIVPGANHGAASTVAHAEFDQRVVNWFDSHDR